MAALTDLHNGCGLALWVDAGEELGDEFDGVLRGGEADALWWRGLAGEPLAGGETVLATDKSVEPFERKREVRAALVVSDGVNLIDDDGADAAQCFARLARGEHQVERLGRGDKDVRRVAQHRRALFSERVAGAYGGSNLCRKIPAFEC